MDEPITTAPEQQQQDGGALPIQKSDVVREAPQLDSGTMEYIKDWLDKIQDAEEFWCDRFDKMRRMAKFTRGKQWGGSDQKTLVADDRYIANITLRHINQRVAAIYAKNPKVTARQRQRINYVVWDGTPEMLQEAGQAYQVAQLAEQQGGLPAGVQQPAMDVQTAMAVLKDHSDGKAKKILYNRIGRSLEAVSQYSLDEPMPKFKTQAKQLVRRVLTCSVGYVKLGYQRIRKPTPDVDTKIKDATDRLEQIQSLMNDLIDKEIEPESKEAAELKLNIEALQKQQSILLREGVMFGFPKPWNLIVDKSVTQLKGFVGAEFLAEKYLFTPRMVQKLYGVDVKKAGYTAHNQEGRKGDRRKKNQDLCCVYEIYDLVGQLCLTLCIGYKGFLKAPGEADVFLEQFHPYYALTFNDTEDDEEDKGTVFPPSDAELLEPMQVEYNRAREGIRVHRQANRPGYLSPKGALGEDTKTALATHADHEIIEHGLPRETDMSKLIQPKPVIKIDPALYDTEYLYTDIQRVGGRQSADLGGTSNATATEVGVAEASRTMGDQSNVDDLDEFLTDVMRGMGQILLLEMDESTVKKIAGEGAVWPKMNREEVAAELCLEIKAGSSGRPNKQARLLAIEKVVPFLLQTPGFKPNKVGELLLEQIDDTLEIEDFYDDGAPSITAMNTAKAATQGYSPLPAGQGARGAMNAPQPSGTPAATQNLAPAPGASPPPAPAPA